MLKEQILISNVRTCSKCNQSVRICNIISIIQGQARKGRVKIFLTNENIGF